MRKKEGKPSREIVYIVFYLCKHKDSVVLLQIISKKMNSVIFFFKRLYP